MKLLVLSNGHGEDQIAVRIIEQLQAIINKGILYSSFGDAAKYQKEIRQERKLPYRN